MYPEKYTKEITEYVSSPNVSSPNVSSSSLSSSRGEYASALASPTPTPTSINKYDETRCMVSRGYYVSRKLAKTLQGSIWCGIDINEGNFNRNIVIKCTNKELHKVGMTVLDGGIKIEIEENIISEMKILKYLTRSGQRYGLNKYITSYIDFFYDEVNYFMVMEHGGNSLFDFVLKAHNCITSNKLQITEWHSVCKILFEQMIDFLDILHNKMKVTHLDISLENMLINDVLITVDPHENDMIHFVPKFNIRFCDFGLAEIFNTSKNPRFLSNKFVGKTNYKAPEVYRKLNNFNAKSADIWSIGVCLFALLIGSMPFNKPCENDPTFQWIISGHIEQLITKEWNKKKYITNNSLSMLEKIFKYQDKRIKIEEILKHPYLS